MADWNLIVEELIKSEPQATKTHEQLRAALASNDTGFIREKVNNLKRLYPSTDWDAKFGLDELETRRLGKMADDRRGDIERAMNASLEEADNLDRLDDVARQTESASSRMAKEALDAIPENNYRARDEVVRLKRFLQASDLTIEQQMEALNGLRNLRDKYVHAAKAVKKPAMKLIKGGLKAMAAIPTPVTAALGAAGWAMDANDAYALTESTMNPQTSEDVARQKMLADLMRRNELP